MKEIYNDRKNNWLNDLDQLAIELPKRHIDLFSDHKKSRFLHAIDQLKQNKTLTKKMR